MRMSCGRSDGEPSNQLAETPWACTSHHERPSARIYYNRLEYSRWFRFFYATAHSSVCLSSAAVKPTSYVATEASIRIYLPRAFLSLVQVRKSCHKQLW